MQPLRREKVPQDFWSTNLANQGNPSHISCSSISIADTGVGARDHPPLIWNRECSFRLLERVLEGSQCVSIMLVQRESMAWPALTAGAGRGVHDPRFLSDGEGGRGVEGGKGEFSTGGPRDRRAGPVALSSLFLCISVLLRGASAGHRAGLRTAIRMGLFWGRASHFVSFCLIRLYLFRRRGDLLVFQRAVDAASGDRVFSYHATACSQLRKKPRKAVSRDVAAVSIARLQFFWRLLLPRAETGHILLHEDGRRTRDAGAVAPSAYEHEYEQQW